VDIEFDAAKNVTNCAKHGVSLAFGAALFEDRLHLVLRSFREIDGEERFKVVGKVDDRHWTAIYVMRGAVFRFVSVRKSNAGEIREYENCD
jgi:uncharacterized protein